MPNVALVPALAKTLLAIAWADGELHPEEETTVKEVVGLLPSMSANEWAVIELYLVAPIVPDERDELLAILQNTIRSAEDKRIALDAVDAMLTADGTITPAEDAVARRVRDVLAAVDVSPLGLVRRAVGGAFRPTPRREGGLQHWRANPIGYLMHVLHNAPPDRVLDVAALAAAIMAQVVRITPATADAERPVLHQALAADWGVTEAQAAQIAELALAVTRRNVDYHRISRELVPRSTEAQRVALLHTLFAIANAADNVAPDEIDEIRVIAERLQLTRQQFIAAKLTIPAADRGGL
jgi:uncharacterized tellurite resistance protein B-like protein